jgi:hypothetical protein
MVNETCYVYKENGYDERDNVPEYVLLKTFTGTDCSRKAIIWMHNRMTPDMYAEKVDEDNMHTFWDPDIAKWVD